MSSNITKDIVHEPFWSLPAEETLGALKTTASGLTEKEAASRLKAFGHNVVSEKEHSHWFAIILRQLKNPLINILIIAGSITIVLEDWISAGAIFGAVLVNTSLGFWQEFKAEKSLQSLKAYIQSRARVRRDGVEREIDASELVPGDIIRVSQGNRIPADARLIFTNNVEVDEAVLTGESLSVSKNTAELPPGTILPERKSIIFSGTLMFQGVADAVVTATGSDTAFGKIAALVAVQKHDLTPLQRSIMRLTVIASLILGGLSAALFIAGLFVGYDLYEMFLIAVAVAVAAVPEALPVTITVALAIGVVRLAKKKGVVRKLLAAETLGSTTLILTDKTGTLTQAKMRLEEIVPYRPGSDATEATLLHEALINADVIIENPSDPPQNWRVIGGPLAMALVTAAAERGILYPHVKAEHASIDHLPFSSRHKLSAMVYRHRGTVRIALFGAPEAVLRHVRLPDDERALMEEEVHRRAASGERILSVAAGTLKHAHIVWEDFLTKPSRELSFLGLLSFSDPLRPEIKGAVKRILNAGVRTAIVTGDHKGTAESIARELGMIDGKGATLTGEDMKQLAPDELATRAPEISVFARVDPEQKLQLVNLYKSHGEVVAVTGDGVNDAPALHAADIGVAVGSGTEVAKGAADLVLLDDNFQTLVTAIEEGRKIIDNIRKIIVYLFSNVLDALFLIAGALLMGLPLPLNAAQMLFANFFADSFPAIALAFDESTDNNSKKARKISHRLIDREMGFLIFGVGIFTSFLLVALYLALTVAGYPLDLIRTIIFACYATYILFFPFSLRSLRQSIFSYNPFSNRYLVGAVSIGTILTLLAIYLPAAQMVFKTVPLPPEWLAAVIGFGFLTIALVELIKFLFRRNIIRS